MYVDSEGNASSDILIESSPQSQDQAGQYIVLKACLFDPSGKEGAELGGFVQNEFAVTLKNVLNPAEYQGLTPFTISVFRSMDSETNELTDLLTETTTFTLAEQTYISKLTSPSLASSLPTFGASEGNTVTLSMTSANALPSSGVIELLTPIWALQYNSSTGLMDALYPLGDPEFACFFQGLFESIDISSSAESMFRIEYEGVAEGTTEISFKCTNWRNPVNGGVGDGFLMKTYDEEGVLINQSDEFGLDATEFEAYYIEDSLVAYELSDNFTRVKSDYTINFTSVIPVLSGEECLVQIVFPPELNAADIDVTQIKGSGMLLQSDGSTSNSF
jgi:hypothetical protein